MSGLREKPGLQASFQRTLGPCNPRRRVQCSIEIGMPKRRVPTLVDGHPVPSQFDQRDPAIGNMPRRIERETDAVRLAADHREGMPGACAPLAPVAEGYPARAIAFTVARPVVGEFGGEAAIRSKVIRNADKIFGHAHGFARCKVVTLHARQDLLGL
jgi:hypothetical protein